MNPFWLFLYDCFVLPALYFGLRVAGLFNAKIKRGILGREHYLDNLQTKISSIDRSIPLVWVHSASLGEFEQAKPIIEKIKACSRVSVIVTFFSPSGYENSKRYPFADIIAYAPFDFPSTVKKFYSIVNPSIGIFMRYDIWPNLVNFATVSNVPLFLVDATMRSNSIRKNFLLKSFHSSLFSNFKGILTVSKNDLESFNDFKLSVKTIESVGDTRFDRVYEKSLEAKSRNLLRPDIYKEKQVFVAGSSWEEDEEILIPVVKKLIQFNKSLLAIIVPHEPTISHIEKIEQEFNGEIKTIRFSYLNDYSGQQVIIVDSIGILLSLYYYASVAFVGGSFKSSIHNILEAAVYGIPVIYGPKIQSSNESKELAELGGGIIVNSKSSMYRALRRLLAKEAERIFRGTISKEYIVSNIGAADKIVAYLAPYIKVR